MNLLSRKWTAILLMAVPFWANAQKGIELKDPSGKIQLNVMLGNTVTYSVSHEEDVIIETSPVSMTLTDGTVLGEEKIQNGESDDLSSYLQKAIYKRSF